MKQLFVLEYNLVHKKAMAGLYSIMSMTEKRNYLRELITQSLKI